jgi:hypothetical protein
VGGLHIREPVENVVASAYLIELAPRRAVILLHFRYHGDESRAGIGCRQMDGLGASVVETCELLHRLGRAVVVVDGAGQIKGFQASFAPLYEKEPTGLCGLQVQRTGIFDSLARQQSSYICELRSGTWKAQRGEGAARWKAGVGQKPPGTLEDREGPR